MSDPHFIQQYASHHISPSTADHIPSPLQTFDPHPINGHPPHLQQQQHQSQQQLPHPLKNANGHSHDHLNYDSGPGSGYKSSESSGYLPTPTSAQLQHQIYQHSQYYPSTHSAQHHASQDAKIYDPTLGPGPSRRQASQGVMTPVSPARSVEEEFADGRVGVEDPYAERSYSELKCLGDGSFGTVWLCDWHSRVKSNVLLSAMQCGAGARDEWSGKRLVALKRMKRVWEGGWKQASSLGELVSLRKIPAHPAIIPLYDAFISPKSKELYFVFECMEGNLYQLTKSRRGRPLAAGLIASCFHQISSGLYHIHRHGYFHRDMKPENLLVTTTGLTDYLTSHALNAINTATAAGQDVDPQALRYEKDVSVIVKLADFGLARQIESKPPYTEYVSTRWYRAPEVLLRSVEYGAPVDMWALGTILAEMLNLKPLFPGVSEIDQVYRICDCLGDPSSEYGVDERGRTIGGGSWNTGIKLAKNVGFSFPKRKPVKFRGLFNENVPQSLVDCIADLLIYNPKYRLTSAQCVDHPYFHETRPHLQRTPPLPRIPFSQGQPAARHHPILQSNMSAPPRPVPPSHSHSQDQHRPAFANGDMRTLPPPVSTPEMAAPPRMFFPGQARTEEQAYGTSALIHQLRELDLPTDDLASYGHRPAPSPHGRPDVQQQSFPVQRLQNWLEDPQRQNASTVLDGSNYEGSVNVSNPSFPNLQALPSTTSLQRPVQMGTQPHVAAFVQSQAQLGEETPRYQSPAMMPPPIEPTVGAARPQPATIGKKKKWGLSSVFGKDERNAQASAAQHESHYANASTSSLKRTPSGTQTSDRAALAAAEASAAAAAAAAAAALDPKKAKKLAEQQRRELEKAKREAQERAYRERARAVTRKHEQLVNARQVTKAKGDIEFGDSYSVIPEAAASTASLQQPIMYNALRQAQQSQANLPAGSASSANLHRQYANIHPAASASASSVRSLEGQRGFPQLSAEALQAHQLDEYGPGPGSRHKARKRDEGDDHSSISGYDRGSKSRSVLTVGTIDSDPGPRRMTREAWELHSSDPKRAPSASYASSKQHSKSRLMSSSNPSLESQLAHDFNIRATVAPSASSHSLGRHSGRHASSQLGLHDSFNLAELNAMHGSAPTSPYGHPSANAVALGGGLGRERVLPTLGETASSDGSYQGHINPMFRVPPAQSQSSQGKTTLPPFSAIASVADHTQPQQHPPPPPQR